MRALPPFKKEQKHGERERSEGGGGVSWECVRARRVYEKRHGMVLLIKQNEKARKKGKESKGKGRKEKEKQVGLRRRIFF